MGCFEILAGKSLARMLLFSYILSSKRYSVSVCDEQLLAEMGFSSRCVVL